jgi:hypothetical protein
MRVSRTRKSVAALALAAALVLPASASTADPVATKSGAIINYVSTGKLKIGKKILIEVVCSVNCNVTSTTVVKGPGFKRTLTVSGSLQANATGGGPFVQPNGALLKAMKAEPGRFKFINSITASDPSTGATDSISRTFKLKR